MRAALPAGRVAQFDTACAAARLREAFATRREIVNYKKAMLLLFQDAREVEAPLRQLLMVLYTADFVDGSMSARYEVLSNALQRVRALLLALHDARAVTKSLCALPRHPAAAAALGDPALEHPYRHLHARCGAARVAAFFRALDPACPDLPDSAPDADPAEAARCPPPTAVAAALRDLGWPDYVLDDFVAASLAARGADKALRIRHLFYR